MRLEELFGQTRAHWVKYSEYEYREDDSGKLFITPTASAKVGNIYNPLKDSDALVVDAINAGLACMSDRLNAEQRKKAVLEFVSKYGLLGFMTALPTTPDFMGFDTAYLPKNPFIEAASMPCVEYIGQFFPFEKLALQKIDTKTRWDVTDKEMMALLMTMDGLPMAANMTYHRAYSEPYEWVQAQLKDWAFILVTSTYYYDEKDDVTRELYRRGINAFGGLAPAYHIVLAKDKPTIVWDFQSLLRTVQMAFSYALTDETQPLRLCKGCGKAFIASNPKQRYCSPKCKENVKKK